jgi:hypothetical protein
MSVVKPVRWVVLIKKLVMVAVKPFCKPMANDVAETKISVSSKRSL